jgi:hypothetical protein
LAELQRRFQAAVLARDALPPEFTAAATQETAKSRFRIYREAYRLRLAEALAADYPALQALLGAEEFAALASAYAESRPVITPSVGPAQGWPSFCATGRTWPIWPA